MVRRLVVLACAAAAFGAGVLVREAQAGPPAPSAPGRFQVVNGTPSLTRNIMLLDTATGRTWVVCGDENVASAWCAMPLTQSPSEPKTQP